MELERADYDGVEVDGGNIVAALQHARASKTGSSML